MSRYKINEEAIEIWGNKGGGGLTKEKLFLDSRVLLNEFEDLLNDLRLIRPNEFGSYVCSLKYAKIPAKKWRLNFGIKPETISDVKQRGVFTFEENNNYFTKLFYELEETDIHWMIGCIEEVISAESYISITNNVYENFLDKIITKSSSRNNQTPNLRIKKIDQSIQINSFENIKVVRVLPIIGMIDVLQNERFLNETNFDPELMIAFLTYDELTQMLQMGFNIFYSISDFLDYEITETNFDQLINPIQISGPARRETIGVIDSGNTLGHPFNRFILSNEDHRELGSYHANSHGSSVASLIIANDELNPTQKDHLGNFNIKHFEILEPFSGEDNANGAAGVQYQHLMRVLPEIIRNNDDIKVWNLSFGAVKSPYSRMISDQGKLLDKLSNELNVIFVIASGNEREEEGMYSLNSPGDSLNSLTVGSSVPSSSGITYANYSSIGPILHFEKPEVSHFGGPENIDGSPLILYGPGFSSGQMGTSFAAPRVSRMVAAFISDGLSPSEAKAKVISMAIKETPSKRSSAFGHIENKTPAIELNLEPIISSKKPRYIPIELPANTEEIRITLVNQVEPRPIFGEEYSIQNFEGSIVIYDSSVENPENDSVGLRAKNLNSISNKYSREEYLRFENGKYFNSSMYITKMEQIEEKRSKLLERGCVLENIKVAIRIKKLDLFETVRSQIASVAMITSIYGDNISVSDFEADNINILDIEVNVEV